MNKNAIIVTTVGLIIGTAEALLYYNLGQNQGQKFAYRIPPSGELVKTISLVLLTSVLTAGISGFIESRLTHKEPPLA